MTKEKACEVASVLEDINDFELFMDENEKWFKYNGDGDGEN